MLKNLTATNKGLVTGIVMILFQLVLFYLLKLPVNENDQYVLFSVYIIGILWSSFAYKQSNTENKTFKSYFSNGFKTFIVATLLMVIFTFIFFSIDNSYRDNGIAQNNSLLLKEGNHTASEIAENAKQLKKMFMPIMIGITMFKYLILGALVTAVTSGFLAPKSKPTN